MRIFAASLLLIGCGMGIDQQVAPDAGPPTADQATWLDPQNAVRAQAQPAPSPALAALRWSDSAEQVAQAWANNCIYQHNANRGQRGENIAADTPPGALTPATVVSAWAGEVRDYDYAANTCAAGKECGHYTQIVWRGTTAVGCAHAICPAGSSPFGDGRQWDFWVCDYEPPGNVIGQKPY